MVAADSNDERRSFVARFVQQWESEYLKPTPEIFICNLLDYSRTGVSTQQSFAESPVEREVLAQIASSRILKDDLNRVAGEIIEQSKHLERDACSTPQFENLLEQLDLCSRNDLDRISQRFLDRGVIIVRQRDSIRIVDRDVICFSWRILFHKGIISTISHVRIFDDLLPSGISRIGELSTTSVHSALTDVYAFLAKGAQETVLRRNLSSTSE